MAAKRSPSPPRLTYNAACTAGRTDNAGRWHPYDMYRIPGSFKVRCPSRAYPYSYVKHFTSAKYARLLFEHDPRTYFALASLDTTFLDITPDEPYAALAAALAARRLIGR